mmetsp:Transcript_37644/g.111332  ORF Transcript_37644/g.111332 Transcript_37644/m.111332 type:complete len:213 (+) Transcript_37644:589-1227(+)
MDRQLVEEVQLGALTRKRLVLHHEARLRHAGQDARPAPDHLGSDLCKVVERTKRDVAVAQRRQRRHLRRVVCGRVAQEAAGKPHQLLHKCLLGIRRVTQRISQAVVDHAQAGRVGVPDPRDLHRRRPHRQRAQPVVCGVSGQLHQNVDAIGTHLLGELRLRHRGGVAPQSAGGLDQPPQAQRLCVVLRRAAVHHVAHVAAGPVVAERRLGKV